MSVKVEKTPASVEVKNAIRARLKANMKLDRRELAAHYNVSNSVVGAIYTHLKIAEINQTFDKIDKIISKVGKKKHKQGVFTNQDGANKEVARTKMADIIIKSNVVGIMPTLANKTWAIEQKIAMGLKGIEFLGIENDPVIFTEMKRALKKTTLTGKTYYGSISDKIFGQLEDTYAGLILDYCGCLPTFSKEIEYAITNNIVKVGGIIAVTVAKPIRDTLGAKSARILNLATKSNTDFRCDSDRATEAYFNKITGWNYEVQEIFYYQDTYPMVLVLIKRLK
jgi:hypothetical protein